MSKFAVVTGANKGIGRVTSIALARNGWQVGLLGRDLLGLQSVADEIGDTALPVHCDVSDRK